MSSEAPVDRSAALRSWWQLAAGCLATATALTRLSMTSAGRTSRLLPADGQLDPAADASYWAFMWEVVAGTVGNVAGLLAEIVPAMVVPVVVPIIGAWLALQREPVRARLGLATVAAWGVMFGLATLVATLAIGPVPQHLPWLATGTLGTAALVAALLALRAHPGPFRLEAPLMRTVAMAAIAMWGVAQVAAVVLPRLVLSPAVGSFAPTDGEWFDRVIGLHLPGLVAVLAIAVVVWRYDVLLGGPAATVVAVQAAMSLPDQLASPLASAPGARQEAALPEIAGLPVDTVVHSIAALMVIAAVAGFVLAARAKWHAHTEESAHADDSAHRFPDGGPRSPDQ